MKNIYIFFIIFIIGVLIYIVTPFHDIFLTMNDWSKYRLKIEKEFKDNLSYLENGYIKLLKKSLNFTEQDKKQLSVLKRQMDNMNNNIVQWERMNDRVKWLIRRRTVRQTYNSAWYAYRELVKKYGD